MRSSLYLKGYAIIKLSLACVLLFVVVSACDAGEYIVRKVVNLNMKDSYLYEHRDSIIRPNINLSSKWRVSKNEALNFKDSIINIFYDPIKKEKIFFFANATGSYKSGIPKILSPDRRADTEIYRPIFEYGVILKDEKRCVFKNQEIVLCSYDGYVITKSSDEIDGKSTIRSYKSDLMDLKLIDSLVFKSPFINFFPIKNGRFIALTEGDDIQHNLLILNLTLKKVMSFAPFEGEVFTEFDVASNEEISTIAFLKNNRIKKITIDENCKVLHIDSLIIHKNSNTEFVQGFSQFLYRGNIPMLNHIKIIDGQNVPTLSGYNRAGKKIWENNCFVSGQRWKYDDIFLSWNFKIEKLLLCFNEPSNEGRPNIYIGTLNEGTGIVKNKIEINDCYEEVYPESNSRKKIKLTYLGWHDSDRFLLILSETLKDREGYSDYVNSILLSGKVRDSSLDLIGAIPQPFKVIKVITQENKIEILTNKFKINYNYEN